MGWFYSPFACMAYLTGTFDLSVTPPVVTGPPRYPHPAEPEKWLIEVAYGQVATETACARCGAPLGGPHLRARTWPVRVDVRCTGPRRHRHHAVVRRRPEGLRTGPLKTAWPHLWSAS